MFGKKLILNLETLKKNELEKLKSEEDELIKFEKDLLNKKNIISEEEFKKNHQKIAFVNVNKKYNFDFQRKQGYIKFLKQKKNKNK